MESVSTHTVLPYISGNFVSITKCERTFSVHNPAVPSEVLAVSGWNKDFSGRIIESISGNLHVFKKLQLKERLNLLDRFISILRSRKNELLIVLSKETSRSSFSVKNEWDLCEKLFEILPNFCQHHLTDQKSASNIVWYNAPIGKILVSTNISMPVYSLLSTICAPLVAGNAVCIVPSVQCLLSSDILAHCFHEAQFPTSSVQFVYGDLEVFRRLVLTHSFDVISYVGNEENQEQIKKDASTSTNVKIVLNGAGKNVAYVTDTADIQKAVGDCVLGACLDSGQRLEATGLVFVDEKIFSQFQDACVQAIKTTPVGAREDMTRTDAHIMGALSNKNSWDRFLRFQSMAARECDETLRWGKPIDNPGDGYFVSPGLHRMSSDKLVRSVYATNPFFGPDLCLIPVQDDAHVISLLDHVPSARALSIHTQYPEHMLRFWRLSSVPSVLWNAPTTQIHPEVPIFGRTISGNMSNSGIRFLFSTIYPHSLNIVSSGPEILTQLS